MNLKYQIDTKFNHDCIELTEGFKSNHENIFDQTKRNIMNLREQAVRDALNKLGWLSPEEAKEMKIKAERYDWIKENIEEEVTQRADEFVGVKTKYKLPYLHAYAEFTGQIDFDDAVDIAMGKED